MNVAVLSVGMALGQSCGLRACAERLYWNTSLMDNMNRPIRQQPKRTLDGIINGPLRPRAGVGRQLGRQPVANGSLRTNGRTIGDFRRASGFHGANAPVAATRNNTVAATPPHAVPGSMDGGIMSSSLLRQSGTRRRANILTRKKGDKRRRDWHKLLVYGLRGSLVTVALVLVVGGFLFAKGYIKLHKVFKGGGSAVALDANVDPSLLKGEGDGRVNMLLLGRGGEGHAGADLTDTLLVASIDPVTYKVGLVSVPRDLWVTTANGTSKINSVFAYAKQRAAAKGSNTKAAEAAGLKAISDEVSDVLGIPLHYYAMVDFKAFEDAVNTVGGVDIQVTEETSVREYLWDGSTGKNYLLNVQPGLQHFDGKRALFYARSRYTSPRGDFDRSERQRLLIQALSKKVTSAGTYTNPVKISQLMDNFGDHVSTDMSIDDALRLMTLGKKIGGNFTSVDLANPTKPLVRTGMIDGQSVVMPVAGVDNYDDIRLAIRSAFKDGYIAKENAKITVLNGTSTPGLATEKADELRTYGYNIGTVGDAPTTDYSTTTIVDLTSGKMPYTENYLEKRFGVKVATKLPTGITQPQGVHFVIILGNNETLNR